MESVWVVMYVDGYYPNSLCDEKAFTTEQDADAHMKSIIAQKEASGEYVGNYVLQEFAVQPSKVL